MDNLYRRFLNDRLTPDELNQLRTQLNETPDDLLEKGMEECWRKHTFSNRPFPGLEKGRQEVFRRVGVSGENKTILPAGTSLTRSKIYKQLVAYAAIIMIPILVFASFYWYERASSLLLNEDTVILADQGMPVSIQLPDGTDVTLNAGSSLRYNLKRFNKKERRIKFDGEGYFDVTKLDKSPFLIEVPDMQVRVLGTRFNLLARTGMDYNEIFLEEGHVNLLAADQKRSQELYPQQKAIFNKKNGTFSVKKEDGHSVSYWRRGELHFSEAPLSEVMEALSETFDVKFSIESKTVTDDDRFTGTLNGMDLLHALDVIQSAYNLNYEVSDRLVIFTDRK